MTTIKLEQSKSYREFLLKNLQDSEHAAGYLEAALEEQDGDLDFLSQLLKSVLSDVVEAQASDNPSVRSVYDRFCQSNPVEIYHFVQLLDQLGFQVSIAPKR
jgi:DNA-binding phage protein